MTYSTAGRPIDIGAPLPFVGHGQHMHMMAGILSWCSQVMGTSDM